MQWADLGCRAVSLIWLLIMRQLEKKGGKITSLPGWLSKSSQSHPARRASCLAPVSALIDSCIFASSLSGWALLGRRTSLSAKTRTPADETLNTTPFCRVPARRPSPREKGQIMRMIHFSMAHSEIGCIWTNIVILMHYMPVTVMNELTRRSRCETCACRRLSVCVHVEVYVTWGAA